MEKRKTYYELAKEKQGEYKHDIILALVDGQLKELRKEMTGEEKEIEFLTVAHSAGRKTYVRGTFMVMMKAVYQVLGKEKVERVAVEHSMGPGYYVEITGEAVGAQGVSEEIREKIEDRMRELVKEDIIFEKYSIHTTEAVKRFHEYRMYDKEKLFQYRRVSKTNLYNLDGFEDYFFGYMPYSTGILKYFKLYCYGKGMILQLPTQEAPDVVPEFEPRHKLFSVLREANQWNQTMEIATVGALNDVIASGGMSDLMLVQEALQEKKIGEIAEQIAKAKDKKFVMIAGPSSSGKTTFSHRLSIQLRTFGLKPHPIGVDDYFVERERTPKNPDGSYNFECLEAIDVEQFNKDMLDLLDGKTVELPSFNFKTGKREYKGNYKKLGKDDILVIEGIHGLNEKLSYSLPSESKFKIYISALTTLNIDEHNRIPTSDGRLIRRMVRDARTRGSSAARTIDMWSSVRAGEEQYIFPFQEEADVMFNSALIYELAVLKQYAEPILFGIREDEPAYMEAKRILKFLDYFVGVSSEDVPKNSILREFVGNSYFHV
jgi:uridine kinase